MCKTDITFLFYSHLTAVQLCFNTRNRKCVAMQIKYISHDDKHEIGQQVTNSIYHTIKMLKNL